MRCGMYAVRAVYSLHIICDTHIFSGLCSQRHLAELNIHFSFLGKNETFLPFNLSLGKRISVDFRVYVHIK